MICRLPEWGWRSLPGVVVALVVAGICQLSLLDPLEHLTYRLLFHLRGERPWSDRLVLVAIDDVSIQQLGRFPWSRAYYTRLLHHLTQADAGVVMFDLLWSESSPEDGDLAQAMLQQGRVVLAQAWDATGVPLLPVPQLREAAIAQGQIQIQQDPDGMVRQVPAYVREIPTLGIATTQAYGLVRQEIPIPQRPRPLWLNWVGSARSLPQYSFAHVLEGKVPAIAFQDKIVLVGVTATGLDPLITPFDRNPPGSSILLHATVIQNLLQQNFLTRLPPAWIGFLLLLGGPGLSWAMAGCSTRRQLLVVTGLCVGWGSLSLLGLQLGYWLPVATPISLFVLTAMAVALTERLRENALLEQKLAALWNDYYQDLTIHTAPSSHLLIQDTGQRLTQPSIPLQRVAQLTALAEQFGRSQAAQAAIARSLRLGLVAADLDGDVWFCNPTASRWLRIWTGSQLQTGLSGWISPQLWQATLNHLQRGEAVIPQELNSGDRWLELRLEPLRYGANRTANPLLDGVLLVLEDITARKRIELTLSQEVRDLTVLTEVKDEFLNTVTHELRGPMTNIRLIIEMLQIDSSRDKQEEYLRILGQECDREASLINDLLDLQRLESGKQSLQLRSLPLQTWLPQLVEPFYYRADHRQIRIDLQVPSDLPPLDSDPDRLDRVLGELLNNACKYTPPGESITIVVDHNSAEDDFRIRVQNTGVTIPPQECDRIFDKFYRIPGGDRWHQGGTGLGLTLVKRLAESLGGQLSVTSDTNQTTFTLQLPRSNPAVVDSPGCPYNQPTQATEN